jgi:hypothetical protein
MIRGAGSPPRHSSAGARGYLDLVQEVKRVFIVVGEALVDLVGQRGGRTLTAHPGGSPANVALGLGRLGVPVTLKTRLGHDAFGEMIRGHLEASSVKVDGGNDEGVSTSQRSPRSPRGSPRMTSASSGTSGSWRRFR